MNKLAGGTTTSMAVLRRVLLGGLFALPACLAGAAPPPVQIYAAMTFRPALERILAAYRDTGGTAVAVYAPTPVLIRQLAAGAPADILLTADPTWMNEAVRQKLVRPDSQTNLMTNDLVLAGPTGSPIASTITRTFALQALLGGGRLAMCDPDHDPAGRYAKQSLQALGFWPIVSPRIAVAETSLAAVVMVDRGEAAAAVCFKTDVHGDAHVLAIGTFPAETHAPIVYPIALASEIHNAQAPSTLTFLRSPAAMRIFTDFGYTPAT
jgi:molybdate transport system substrate-binding protein